MYVPMCLNAIGIDFKCSLPGSLRISFFPQTGQIDTKQLETS